MTPWKEWAEDAYGTGSVIALYANVTKLKELSWTEPESDWFYDREYEKISSYLSALSNDGYNCVKFGGESDSMVLFNQIQIVNAITGRPM